MNRIGSEQGNIKRDTKGIWNNIKEYFKNLYSMKLKT